MYSSLLKKCVLDSIYDSLILNGDVNTGQKAGKM